MCCFWQRFFSPTATGDYNTPAINNPATHNCCAFITGSIGNGPKNSFALCTPLFRRMMRRLLCPSVVPAALDGRHPMTPRARPRRTRTRAPPPTPTTRSVALGRAAPSEREGARPMQPRGRCVRRQRGTDREDPVGASTLVCVCGWF